MAVRTRQTRETFATAIKEFKKWLETSNLSVSIIAGYESALNTILLTCPFIGIYLKDINAFMLEEYLNVVLRSELNGKGIIYSTKSRKNFASLLRKLFKWYAKKNKIRRSPFEVGVNVEEFDDSEHVMPYTPDEVDKVLREADGSGIVEAFETMVDEGPRLQEVLGLTDSSIEQSSEDDTTESHTKLLINKAIVFGEVKRPKTNRSKRSIVILDDTYEMLERVKRNNVRTEQVYQIRNDQGKLVTKQEKFIFCNPRTGTPWKSSNQYYYALKKFFDKAGVKYRGSRPARHTFACEAIATINPRLPKNENEDQFFLSSIHEVAEVMGHSDSEVLKENYVHYKKYSRGRAIINYRKSHREKRGIKRDFANYGSPLINIDQSNFSQAH
ncbi:TPA: tyrosine-type recombinase/integrase [Photobacterium damselae subsp. damselae]